MLKDLERSHDIKPAALCSLYELIKADCLDIVYTKSISDAVNGMWIKIDSGDRVASRASPGKKASRSASYIEQGASGRRSVL